MKVTPKEILETTIDQKKIQTSGVPGTNFGDILKESIDSRSVSTSKTSVLPPLDRVSRIAVNLTAQPDRAEAISRINEFLNLLEEYQTRMENPSVTLKQTHPLVSRMEAETQSLTPVLEALPEGDDLKDILNRLLVASTVEVIKFNRGDYVV